MAKLLDIIGVRSEEEAKALIEREKQEIKEMNKYWKADNNKGFAKTLVIGAVLIFFLSFCVYWGTKNTPVCVYGGLALFVLFLDIAYCVKRQDDSFFWKNPNDIENYSLPCQFFEATKNKNILKMAINKPSVILTLEDIETHEVSEACINGFKSAVRTDISSPLIDLDNECIYTPYTEEE